MNSEVFVVFSIICIFFSGIRIGNLLYYTQRIEQGRIEGIKFCVEKPKLCNLEYTYLKYKETQK